ncbi:MAG: hypothetical protein AABZ94_06730 [Candidatus Eisenbacteria bacterium]
MRFESFGSASVRNIRRRLRRCGFALAALALFAVPARAAETVGDAATRWVEALRAMPLPIGTRLVESPQGESAGDAERSLREAGYDVAVSIPPRVHVVRATRRAGPLPAGFTLRAEGSRAAASLVGGAAPDGGAAGDPFGGLGDVLPPLRGTRDSAPAREALRAGGTMPPPAGLFYGTRWEDLSEFMVGRVGLGFYFPESDGTVDLDRYDWTPALRDSVVRSAVRGFLAWSNFAAARNIPLSFHLEIHPSLPTRYEPISRPVSQEELWIEDMLRPLVGYRGDAFAMTQEVANGVRSRLGTQWGGLVIAVQNDSSSTGTFPDGVVAHARLGGPWFVIPVNNARSTSATLDFYMEHELTHLFWALDEYPANNAWWSCTLTTGYFERPNWNSDIPYPGYCVPHVDCLMRGNWPNALCQFTAEQVGWVDLDQSATPDLYETRPAVVPDSSRFRVVAGYPLWLRGRAGETALPNRNPYRFYSGDSISVSTIDSVFYRVNGGAWNSLPPLDGIFDEGEESVEVTLDPLPIGNHTIEWQAHNTNGRAAAFNATTAVTVSGSAGAVDPPGSGAPAPLRLLLGPSPGRGPIRFALIGASAEGALVRVWTPAGALAREWRIPGGDSGASWIWDGRLRGGESAPSGVYFVTVDSGGERVRRRLVYLR